MPKNHSPSGRYVAWAVIIERLSHLPHTWLLELPDVPASTARTVRQQRHPDLRRSDGHLEADLRNVSRTNTSQKRGDLYLMWVPEPDTMGGNTPPERGTSHGGT